MAINGVTTTIVNGILSCLHSNAHFIRGKSWKIRIFPKPVESRNVESVIMAISNFSLWSKTLHCWRKLSKSTNQTVYQDLVYRYALLLKILTSVPAPLSPVPLYFSSLSFLRTALHYLNAWNRLALRGTINFLEFSFQIFTEFCLEVLAAKGWTIAHSCKYNSAPLHLPNYFIQQSNLSINKLCLVKMA